jgi:DNA-binding SARP family transcriptional activator
MQICLTGSFAVGLADNSRLLHCWSNMLEANPRLNLRKNVLRVRKAVSMFVMESLFTLAEQSACCDGILSRTSKAITMFVMQSSRTLATQSACL